MSGMEHIILMRGKGVNTLSPGGGGVQEEPPQGTG
jgi:hypothetical protein